MIRAPVVNSVLNSARTVRQLARRQNAFDDIIGVSSAASSSSGKRQPDAPIELRSVTSGALWLLACRNARNAVKSAAASDKAAAQEELARFGELHRLGNYVSLVGGLRPLPSFFMKTAAKWYEQAVQLGLEKGFVVPGETSGVSARFLLGFKMKSTAKDFMEREQKAREKYTIAVQKALVGKGSIAMSDEDLTGIPDKVKSVWESYLGSAAVWRSKKYKVPVGFDSMNRIAFCQNATTRKKVFEAYYANFGADVDQAALELLRARKELAQKMGFESWADYELKPLVIGSPATARQLLDQFWRDSEPAVSSVLRRMEDMAGSKGNKGATKSRHGGAMSSLPHVDKEFYRARVTREADTWKLAQYLPMEPSVPRILETVGRAYSVTFREVEKPDTGRLASGWHKHVRIFEVVDGHSTAGAASLADSGLGPRGRLGYVYLDMLQRTSLGRPSVQLAGAAMLSAGHVYLCMGFPAPGFQQNKLLNPEEAIACAHELGHAVHMLCHEGSVQEFDDLPLDLLEVPSTLAESIAMQPSVVTQYARHWSSGGPPPDGLAVSCHWTIDHYMRTLQSASVALGLHSSDFDPHSATPQQLREAAVGYWQRYSPFEAHPGFTPLGESCGLHIGQGANHIAYILCYMRVDAILHGQQTGKGKERDISQRWLGPEFASRVRSQLLDRSFAAERLAALLPPLSEPADVEGGRRSRNAPPHPLPLPPPTAASLLGRSSAMLQRTAAVA
eukprot:TRINITY_DN50745_c0_g1_i1.p1 TRINITY_DN50745_c0_g1~~TRINITY_DN50745_c0_g1_i1.p1  ORF type:complete len:732 (-),score=178.55 TRINITY_DN50745_c0_g1_i1:29-2224(-)